MTYSYDKLNRLKAGNSTEGFSETGILYDKMGNITSLTRTGFGTLNYTYQNSNQSNQLASVSGFKNGNFSYDANGNVQTDGTRGITLTYNYLNLPQTVAGSQSMTNTYDASGNKLRRVVGSTITEYIDGIQYDNGVLAFIQTKEGRAIKTGTTYNYEYSLKDHLGNNRVAFDQYNGRVGEDNYYPFGLNVHRRTNAGNKYLYNGKELQEELGQYDYWARFYDPVIGRWNVVDPLADEFENVSPYNYAMNNPILMIDPDGMAADTTVNGGALQEVKVQGFRWPKWTYTIPILGAAAESGNNLADGNYVAALGNFGTSLAELFTAGYLSEYRLATNAVSQTTKVASKGVPSGLSKFISKQKQARHLAGTAGEGKGFVNSVDDAQAVLDAVHSGKAQFLGTTKAGHQVFKFNGVTWTNVNLGTGISGQPTNIFMIKGTTSPSVVPTSPLWKP